MKPFILPSARLILRLSAMMVAPLLHQARHAARHRPAALPNPVERFRVGRKVPVPGKRRPERPESISDLPLQILKDQPGSLRDRSRLELVVEGLGVTGLQCRRRRQAFQQGIAGCHLLVEPEGERDRRAQGAIPDGLTLVRACENSSAAATTHATVPQP